MRLEPVLQGLLFAIAFLSLVADALAADVRTARRAVYKIGAKLHGGGAALGSAVLLAPGRLVTNCHTTRDADRILILHREGEIPARMAQMNLRQDLCLLLAPELQGPVPERRPSSQLQIGEQVIAVGYAEGYQPYISEGRITALYQLDGAYVIRTTAGFPRGASGGGLFDEQGRLVGVLTFRATLGEELNYAVPTEWVEPLLEADAIPHEPKTAPTAFWQDNAPAQPIFLEAAWLEKAEAWAELHGVALDWTLNEPDDPEAWLALGRAKLELGASAEAVLALRNVVSRTAQHARAWYWLAVAYHRIGFVDQFVHASVRVERLDAHLASRLQSTIAPRSD